MDALPAGGRVSGGTQFRGVCPVCGWQYALRVDGSVRAHDDGDGYFCDGSGRTDPLAPMTVKRRAS